MLLDGFRLRVVLAQPILKITGHRDINFFSTFNRRRGEEIVYPQKALYKSLRFTLRLNQAGREELIIDGNFYKYLFQLNNIESYHYDRCIDSIFHLCDEFGLKPGEVEVQKLEVGFNFHSPISPEDIIDNIITYKFSQRELQTFIRTGYKIEFPLSQYLIKIYDKSRQFRLDYPLLRIEHKSKSASYLRSKGIRTLEDLLDTKKVLKYVSVLTRSTKDMIIDDRELDLSLLKETERKVIAIFRDERSWKELKAYSPDNCRKRGKRFSSIIKKYSKNDWKGWFDSQFKKAMAEQFSLECK